MTQMTGAQFIADFLERSDVTHVFWVPAVLMQTLREMEGKNRIQRILAHSEKAAVYMADGYARASRRPGVCFAQKIGASNLAAGLRDPHLACTPIIAITGTSTPETQYRHTYQQVEDMPAFEPVTKFNARVDTLERLPDLLLQAFRAATTATPGPVHLEIQGHLAQLEDQKADLEVVVEERFQHLPPFRPVAEPEAVTNAVAALNSAERPLIVAGGGVRASGAGEELVALAERLQIPVATALNAKAMIPGTHPLNVGVPGVYSRKSANRALLETDLVFFAGSHTGSQVTHSWALPPTGTRVIQLDINPEELGRHYPNEVSLMGDCKVSLRAMLEQTGSLSSINDRAGWVKRAQTLVAEWHGEVDALMQSDAVPIRPERICHELNNWLPDNAIMMTDTGHSGMWTGGFIDLKPGQDFLRAAGSLGWGLPAAIGAKLGAPERPVVVFSGDGGFWYHFPELETAVRWNVPIIVIVNNNSSLNQGIGEEIAARDGKLEGRHGDVWRFNNTNFAEVAKSLGAEGIRVEKPDEIRPAFERALERGRPCVIDVVTDDLAEAPYAWLG